MFELLQPLISPLISVAAFILTISFLVTIHEYGHFWVARRFGVKIERFSIGFGKPIIKWYGKRDNTEYTIAWIPLGGYVKMYGETASQFENSGNSATKHDYSDIAAVRGDEAGSFSALSPGKRFAIAFAGPAVNLVFAVLALWVLFLLGIPAIKPTVGEVVPTSRAAQTKLLVDDNITSVGGYDVTDISDVLMRFIDHLGEAQVKMTATDSNGISKNTAIDLSGLAVGSELNLSAALGIRWAWQTVVEKLPATLATVQVGSPAALAGLQVNDTVVQAGDEAIDNWQQLVNIIRANPATELKLQVKRRGQTRQLMLTPKPNPQDATMGFAGISPVLDEDLYGVLQTRKQYGAVEALGKSVAANYLQAALMLKTLGRLVTGEVSVKNLGGPISIADVSGKALRSGYISYFYILATLSLILAVMNLLPIPVLDGGHMLLCSIEMLRGKPLSEKTAALLLRVGMSIILTFMLLAVSVDLWRYLLA